MPGTRIHAQLPVNALPPGCGLAKRLVMAGIFLIALTLASSAWPQQYRSKILIDHGDTLETGTDLSLEQLEQQLDDLTDPYARASTTRHLARQYIQQGEYDKAIAYYQEALAADGLSAVADREILRELARVYLLNEDYESAATALSRALQYELVAEKVDFLLLAQAHFRSGDYVATVVVLDRLSSSELQLDEPDLRQMLVLYYQSGAYSQSAAVLEKLLHRAPENADYWHQLAAVYLLQDQRREALDQLALAYEKRVPFREHNLLLLADLYAYNDQPFDAARILQAEIEQGGISATGEHYRKLFEFWLQAREKEQALEALAAAAGLTGDTELYLHLAQLQSENESWSAMKKTVLEACSSELDDRFVSRANLLLGISQLKLGESENARLSFINATLIGGAGEQAAQWLRFMNARPASDSEARKIVSPCYGSKDRKRRLASTENIATENDQQPDPADATPVETNTIAIREIPALRFYAVRLKMTLRELAEQMEGLATRLAMSQVRAGGEIDGSLHILLEVSAGGPDQDKEMMLAFPTRGNPRSSGRHQALTTRPFRCSHRVYEGPAEGIGDAWASLASDTLEAGHLLNGQARLVFSCDGLCEGESLLLELQLGIE